MDPRYTPIHGSLWHRGFAWLVVAELLLTCSVYVQLPLLVGARLLCGPCAVAAKGVAVGSFGIGLWVLGPSCNWLSQRYRRNKVFAMSTLMLLASLAATAWLCRGGAVNVARLSPLMAVLPLAMGASYGLSKRLLVGTLMIDKCESYNRTEANKACVWCHLAALPLSLVLSAVATRYMGAFNICVAACAMTLAAIVLVASLPFPFKAPVDKVGLFSCDRFIVRRRLDVPLVLLFLSAAVGLVLSLPHGVFFYALLLPGIVVPMLTESAFDSSSKAGKETFFAIDIAFLSLLGMCKLATGSLWYDLATLLLGIAMGYAAVGVLKRMLCESVHCQRGTVLSTLFYSVEFGMCVGLLLGLTVLAECHFVLPGALVCWIIALAIYGGWPKIRMKNDDQTM